MAEITLFEQGAVKVTTARFINENITHSIAGITAVSSGTIPANKFLLKLGFGWGIFAAMALSVAAFPFGLLVGPLIPLAFWKALKRKKATHVVMLHSASGAVDAMRSKDEDLIKSIVNALNDAISRR